MQATAGDVIQLQARVYNYSLADMPDGTRVHARFYAQRWDNTTHDFDGQAFVINELTLDPIPGFNSTANEGKNPNWVFAATTFDTAAHSDSYLVFWVLVWMELNGQLVPEVEGHGLTALPGPATEPVDVAIEPYSNNVGFYRQPFFVAPRTTASRHAPDSVGKLDVDRGTVSPARVSVFEKATVAARLAVDGAPVEPVLLLFFSEDPAHGGEPFDAELVSHIRAGDVYVARVKFQPVTCGAHTIVVAAHAGTARPAIGTATLHVDCKSAERFVGRAENVTSGKPDGKVRVDGDVPFTGTFDLSAATLTITGVLQEVGGAELVKGNGGASFLPVTHFRQSATLASGFIME